MQRVQLMSKAVMGIGDGKGSPESGPGPTRVRGGAHIRQQTAP